jgi:RNA polymerase sigma-70 factor (ECF subfamily)
MEDKELIESFLAGDKAGFEGLVEKYKGMVFNVCFRMLADYNEALDVSQDIFLKIYETLRSFRGEAKFSTYLYTVTLNFCRNRLKALARRGKHIAFSLDDPLETEDGPVTRQAVDTGASPRDIADTKIKEECLQKALSGLSEEQREIIILRDIEGREYAQIGEILRLDIGTVKSRLNRARFALKEKLEGIL